MAQTRSRALGVPVRRIGPAGWAAVMAGEGSGVGAWLWRQAMWLGVVVYATIQVARSAMYALGLKRSHRVGVPVFCVGNLSAGGTGKTPAVVWLTRHIQHILGIVGQEVAVLSRGYGADESRVLAAELPGVPCLQRADRVAGAKAAVATIPHLGALILDDGFSHRRLHRDLNLVLLDATRPLGWGELLPRGLLREPLSALRRADAILLTRSDQISADDLARLRQRVARHVRPGTPITTAVHRPQLEPWQPLNASAQSCSVAGGRCLAVAGIGNPDAFVRTLVSLGIAVVQVLEFPDHHMFTPKDYALIAAYAKQVGADVVMTTTKDAARLDPIVIGQSSVPWVALRIEFATLDPMFVDWLNDHVLKILRSQ